jgi:alkylhydroperoxidase family enzyme
MRIDGLSQKQARWFIRPMYFYLKRRFGKVLTPYTVWAHRPGVLFGLSIMMGAFESTKVLDRKAKLLASIRAAQIVGCPF